MYEDFTTLPNSPPNSKSHSSQTKLQMALLVQSDGQWRAISHADQKSNWQLFFLLCNFMYIHKLNINIKFTQESNSTTKRINK